MLTWHPLAPQKDFPATVSYHLAQQCAASTMAANVARQRWNFQKIQVFPCSWIQKPVKLFKARFRFHEKQAVHRSTFELLLRRTNKLLEEDDAYVIHTSYLFVKFDHSLYVRRFPCHMVQVYALEGRRLCHYSCTEASILCSRSVTTSVSHLQRCTH